MHDRQMSRLVGALALVAGALHLGGCDQISEALTSDSDEVRAAVESTELTRLEATLVMAVAEATPLGQTPDAIAAAVEAALPTVLSPADCVQAEAIGPTVTAQLDGCAGPRGLAISGLMNVAWADSMDEQVGISVTATDLELGGATMTINANGTYRDRFGVHDLDLNTEGIGAAPGGGLVGRLGRYTVEWRDVCYTLEGTWTSTVGDRFFTTGVTDYYGCESYCPAEGVLAYNEVASEDAAAGRIGDIFTVTFLGEPQAAWVATNGRLGQQALQCDVDPEGRSAPGSVGDDDDDLDWD